MTERSNCKCYVARSTSCRRNQTCIYFYWFETPYKGRCETSQEHLLQQTNCFSIRSENIRANKKAERKSMSEREREREIRKERGESSDKEPLKIRRRLRRNKISG